MHPRSNQQPSSSSTTVSEIDPQHPPRTPDELHGWLERFLNIRVARTPMLEGNAAPFDYVCHAFSEGVWTRPNEPSAQAQAPSVAENQGRPLQPEAPRDPGPPTPGPRPSPDCIVWANRGGGKTFLGAVVTLLDLLFKPGIQIRILGGSLEQSQRMHEHLRRLCELQHIRPFLSGKPTARRIRFTNGSTVEVLAASQTSVRGTRVQKVRCDEVDLFDPEVWVAAQLTTRSMKAAGPWGDTVRGSVEALSTMHRPYGLMFDLVGFRAIHPLPEGGGRGAGLNSSSSPTDLPPPQAILTHQSRPIFAPAARRKVFRWGLLDVLEPCGSEHECPTCPIQPECASRAKLESWKHAAGHIAVTDALAMRARVDERTWAAEMLCLRPRRTDTVYPEFDPQLHVYQDGPGAGGQGPSPEPHAQASGLPRDAGFNHLAPTLPAPGPWPSAPLAYIAGMDFGFRSETVILLASVDIHGVVRVEREHAQPAMTLNQHIQVLKSWINQGHTPPPGSPGGLQWIGVDPAGRQRNDQTGASNTTVLAAAGFPIKSRKSGVDEGLRLIRARLRPAPTSEHEPLKPRLLVHERCTRLIECLERYHYPADKPESLEPAKDGFDHACDALRYMILNLDNPSTTSVRTY